MNCGLHSVVERVSRVCEYGRSAARMNDLINDLSSVKLLNIEY